MRLSVFIIAAALATVNLLNEANAQQLGEQSGQRKVVTKVDVKEVFTYDDVMLANYKHLNLNIGVLGVKGAKGATQAKITDKYAPMQHFKVVEGICGIKGSISFESNARPGHFLYIKQGHRWVYLGEYDDKADYLNSACFYPRYNKYFDGFTAYETLTKPNVFLSLIYKSVVIKEDTGKSDFKKEASWKTTFPVQVATYTNVKFESENFEDYYMGVDGKSQGAITAGESPNHHFKLVRGVCGAAGTVSFESYMKPGNFLHNQNYKLYMDAAKNQDQWKLDSCFIPRYDWFKKNYTSYESVAKPGRFIRHRGFKLYIESNDGKPTFKKDASWLTTLDETDAAKYYTNAVFESKRYPGFKMGLDYQDKGIVTKTNEATQHFRVVEGLCGKPGTVSFESVTKPSHYLRHLALTTISLGARADLSDVMFQNSACFIPMVDKYFKGYTVYALSQLPEYFIVNSNKKLKLGKDNKTNLFKKDASWKTIEATVEQVTTYDDVIIVSQNIPGRTMAVKSNNGILTDSDEANRFNVEKGICGVDGTVSFESVEHPGMFLQAIRKKIKLQRFTSIKSKDTACFYPRQEKYFAGFTAYESFVLPNHFVRHKSYKLVLDKDDESQLFKGDASWKIETRHITPFTYADATFESLNLDGYMMGVQKGKSEAYALNTDPELQHFSVVNGLCNVPGTISFKSLARPGHFLRHRGNNPYLYLDKFMHANGYSKDACFYPRYNKYYLEYTAYESVNYKGYFIRHWHRRLKIDKEQNNNAFEKDASWKTNVPQPQHVLTYENVTFESKNKPDEIITYFKNMDAGLSKKESPSTHFRVVQGVCGASGTVSFESVAKPAYFLSVKKWSSKVHLLLFSHNIDSRNNACFYPRYDKYFKNYTAYESFSYPGSFITNKNSLLNLAKENKSSLFRDVASYKTVIPEQIASTYENAVLQSKNYPLRNVGVLKSNGVITSIFPVNQHWRIVPGLCGVEGSVSLESIKSPGYFLRVRQWHQNKIMRVKYNGNKKFDTNACFFQRQDKFFPGYVAYEAVFKKNHFMRHRGFKLYLDKFDGKKRFKLDASWKINAPNLQQVSFYGDALFESKGLPYYNMGVKGNFGYLTLKNTIYKYVSWYQHMSVVPGICNVPGAVSFQWVNNPIKFMSLNNRYVTFYTYDYIDRNRKVGLDRKSCFYPRYDKYFTGYTAYESVYYPNNYLAYNSKKQLYVASEVKNNNFYLKASWKTKPAN